jgi:hypothetical protein
LLDKKLVAFLTVIVPFLSKSNINISSSFYRFPDLVITLARKALSIPAIPIADNKPPLLESNKQIENEAAIYRCIRIISKRFQGHSKQSQRLM